MKDRSNASDMNSQPFYRFLQNTYMWHVVASAAAIFAIGGVPWLLWAFCFRTAWRARPPARPALPHGRRRVF